MPAKGTGHRILLMLILSGAAMVLSASVARRWSWVVAAGLAAFVVRDPIWTWIALAGLVFACAALPE